MYLMKLMALEGNVHLKFSSSAAAEWLWLGFQNIPQPMYLLLHPARINAWLIVGSTAIGFPWLETWWYDCCVSSSFEP